ncbi:hypothetical protein BG004_007249 [Podila humilis]|nr:hypothetical protein BG004_007249 [Podila humilis]
MADKHGALYHPLRVPYLPKKVYVIAFRHSQDDTRFQGLRSFFKPLQCLFETQLPDENALKDFAILYEICMGFYSNLESGSTKGRRTFRIAESHAQHYHGLVTKEIQKLQSRGIQAQIEELGQDQILEELERRRNQVPDHDFNNLCGGILYDAGNGYDYRGPRLFIVLPSGPEPWDDSDPETQTFRLYFLCDVRMEDDSSDTIPQHVHLSNHRGYNISRPQEFFHTFGDHVLQMLRMVKRGFQGGGYEIPPLHSFRILWGHRSDGSDTCEQRLSQYNIEILVNKAIYYLEKVSPPKSFAGGGLSRSQSLEIKTFLDVNDNDNLEGNLQRFLHDTQFVFWMCHDHKSQLYNSEPLENLVKFVTREGGHIDIQNVNLDVELHSFADAEEFCELLTISKFIANITIHLSWKAKTRQEVQTLCTKIGNSKAVTLAIDGITPDIHPQGYVQYMKNLFGALLRHTQLQFITLLNYPQLQEQTVYTSQLAIQSVIPQPRPMKSTYDNWLALKLALGRSSSMFAQYQDKDECLKASRDIQPTLEEHGFSGITSVHVHGLRWNGLVDLEAGALVQVHANYEDHPRAALATGTLQAITMDRINPEFEADFLKAVSTNSGLRELNLQLQGYDEFVETVRLFVLWQFWPISLCLTLYERIVGGRGRTVAQAIIRRPSNSDRQKLTDQRQVDMLQIEFSQWNCDYIGCQLSDASALYLDLATQHDPYMLKAFTLDISTLSKDGICNVQNVLKRSKLEQLKIQCTAISPDLVQDVSRLFQILQLSTVKSLEFVGENIEEWLQLGKPGDPHIPFRSMDNVPHYLLRLIIQGTGTSPQLLSHSSFLLVHELIYGCPGIEVKMENLEFSDQHDWEILIQAADPELLSIISVPIITS